MTNPEPILRNQLLRAITEPSAGASATNMNRALDFLAERLAAADFDEAVSLLLAAHSPGHAVRRQRDAATNTETPLA